MVLVIAAIAAGLLFVVGASANLSGSTFEGNDGNLAVNTSGNTDWDQGAPNKSAGQDLPTGTADNSFGGGSKEDETAVKVGLGSIPNSKADLARFAVAGEQLANGNSLIYLAWSRENQSGTVNFDFEINKIAQPDLTTSGDKTLNRTVNDLLITYDFSGGAQNPSLNLRKWTGSAWGAPQSLSGCSEGQVNGSTVSENLTGGGAVDRPAAQFGEAAIDLTCANVIPNNSCTSFADAYVKSRSSTSFTSEIKDFIAPIAVDLDFCGSITIIKHTNPRGLDKSFDYTTTGGLSPSTFSLNDSGNQSGDNAANTRKYSDQHEGTYTVTETAPAAGSGFAFNNVSCTGGGSDTTTSGRTATIGLDANEDIVCTYVNDQQLGAIRVKKQSIKGNTALPNAKFLVDGNEVTTGSDGTVCVDHLQFGNHTVKESAAPTGYSIDDTTTHTVNVSVNQDCSGLTGVTTGLTFNDTPLTDISVTVNSQDDGAGGTLSTINCVKGATSVGSATSAHDPSVSITNQTPGTYVCTVVVDP